MNKFQKVALLTVILLITTLIVVFSMKNLDDSVNLFKTHVKRNHDWYAFGRYSKDATHCIKKCK
jgi:hypothetical protein